MRFMVMHKVTEEMEEKGTPPTRGDGGVGASSRTRLQRGIFVSAEGSIRRRSGCTWPAPEEPEDAHPQGRSRARGSAWPASCS